MLALQPNVEYAKDIAAYPRHRPATPAFVHYASHSTVRYKLYPFILTVGTVKFSAAYLTLVEQAHLHVAYAPIPIEIYASEPVAQAVLVASILLAQHKVHVVFVRHGGSGIRPVLISPSLRKGPWTNGHNPENQPRTEWARSQ